MTSRWLPVVSGFYTAIVTSYTNTQLYTFNQLNTSILTIQLIMATEQLSFFVF